MASGSEEVDWKDSRPLRAPKAPPYDGIDPSNAVDATSRRLQIRGYLEYHGQLGGLNKDWKEAERSVCLALQARGTGPEKCRAEKFDYMVDVAVWNERFCTYPDGVRPKWPYSEVTKHLKSKVTSEVYRAFVEAQNTAAAAASSPAQTEGEARQDQEGKELAVGSDKVPDEATTAPESPERWLKCLDPQGHFRAELAKSAAGSNSPSQVSRPAPESKDDGKEEDKGKGKEVARVPVAIPPGLSQSMYAPGAAKGKGKGRGKAVDPMPAKAQPSSAAAALAEREAWENSEEGQLALEDARLLKGILPEEPEPLNLSVREQIWAAEFRGLDWKQVGRPVCGPFELEFPAWLDLETFFLGTTGVDLRRVVKEHLDALLCLSWRNAPELRGSEDAAMPVKIVLGPATEALEGLSRGEDGEPVWSGHPSHAQLGKACVAFWHKLLDWNKRAQRNEPLPLIEFVELEEVQQRMKHLDMGGSGLERPGNESAAASAAWSVALDKARTEIVEVLSREKDFGAAMVSMTAWVRRQASGPFRGVRAVAFAADHWVKLVTGEQQREVLRWRRELTASLEREMQAARPPPGGPAPPTAPRGPRGGRGRGDRASWAHVSRGAGRGTGRGA
ncbi:hypothetical protein Purlil1_939 [Purpureocillium lilacinum]|uniref:Uncharacterized protein n=1 Tax=Purpureocillium lilacinum TaxID=33203 RepID=A0ABR0CD34_PURLI|nr:hypothetical protein Purlil1_939 [Purpureocillium lilacinum]